MNKIDTFSITEMTVSGFKNFTEPRTFSFFDINSIIGKNGQGKTTIADAIAYAITGVPFFGETGLDRLYTMEQRDMSVALTIVAADGIEHKLVRARRNDDTSITFDGYTVRQNELITMFGEKEVFLSIFNPLYFIEALGDKGRNLLERYLPTVPHDAVMAKLSESTRELLQDMDLTAPENVLEYLRVEIRDAEKAITYTEGQRDLLGAQTIEGLAVLAEKKEQLSEIKAEIDLLETKKTTGFDFDAMREQLTDLYARRDEAQRDLRAKSDTTAIDTEITVATSALERLRAQTFVSSHTEQIAAETASYDLMKKRYASEKKTHDEISVGIQCPVCKQLVTEENISAIKQSFVKSINTLIENGNALRARIEELRKKEAAERSAFEQQTQACIAESEAALETLNQTRAFTIHSETSADESAVSDIASRIRTMEDDIRFGGLDPDEQWRLEGLQKDVEKLTTEIATLEAPPPITSAAKDKELAELKVKVAKNKNLSAAVKYYLESRSETMLSEFDMLNRVKIILYEVVKGTGELKSVFKFSFDGKPYKYLSLSEKIRAGLEVSALMKRLTARDYPVYIDNGESVPVIDNIRPTGQVFIAQVVKGAELEVRAFGAPAAKQAA